MMRAPGRQGLDHQRRRPDQPALLHAQADRHQQREAAQGRLDDPAEGLRHRRQVLVRGVAARQERHHVRHHRQRRRLRAERQDRRDPLGVLVRHRPEDLHGVLRLGQPRPRHGRGAAVLRPARRQRRGAGHEDGQGGVEDADREVGERLHDHQRPALLRRHRLQRHRRRGVRRARPPDRPERQERRDPVALVHAARTRRVRQRHLAARHRSLDARRRHDLEHAGARSGARARLLRRPATAGRTTTARCARATTSSAPRWWR